MYNMFQQSFYRIIKSEPPWNFKSKGMFKEVRVDSVFLGYRFDVDNENDNDDVVAFNAQAA